MLEQEKYTRTEILKQLDISEDTLSLYEAELELLSESAPSPLEHFTQEDLSSVRFLHKLRESGLTYNEIKLLGSFASVLKNTDFGPKDEIKNLLLLSPVYRLKQSLNLAKQELTELRAKALELENKLGELSSGKSLEYTEEITRLKAELEVKEKSFNSLDRKLSEIMHQKAKLESEVAVYKEAKNGQVQIKGKKQKNFIKSL